MKIKNVSVIALIIIMHSLSWAIDKPLIDNLLQKYGEVSARIGAFSIPNSVVKSIWKNSK